MKLEDVRIVFMGTPDFAVPTLRALHEAGLGVVGVVTAPDRLGGRGRKHVITSAVKQYAQAEGLTILQPTNLKSGKFYDELVALKPDMLVVVAFRMLPEVIWNLPRLGTINLHGSLLPSYRGAAPINWAIINGEDKTGLTTFFIQKEIDTGGVLLTREVKIFKDDTAGSLHDRMMLVGATLMTDTIKGVLEGKLKARPQDHSLATKAPKIFFDMCEINFAQPVVQVYNFIRGLSPYPAAWTLLDGLVLKIRKVVVEQSDHCLTPGQIRTNDKDDMSVATENGWIQIKELQLEGKRQMDAVTFLNGYDLSNSEIKRSTPQPS